MAKLVHLRNIKRALQLEPSSSVKYVVGGRVSNFRAYKSINFIDLIDGSTQQHLQVIVKKDLLKKPQIGSYLICQGDMAASPGRQQALEFKVEQLNYLGECDPRQYPLVVESSDKRIRDGWFRRNLHLRPRTSHFGSLLRVRSELEMAMHMIFKQMDFIKVHTPILTSNDSEASSNLFMVQRSKYLEGLRKNGETTSEQPEDSSSDSDSDPDSDEPSGCKEPDSSSKNSASLVDPNSITRQLALVDPSRHLKDGYFRDRDVFMITSAQLHLESLAASLSRVYCLAACFRAETTLSQRHLCEFTMLEAEESNVTNLDGLLARVESVVKFCAQYLGEVSEFKGDFASLLSKYANETTYRKLAERQFIRMTYDEALEILQKPQMASEGVACQYGSDLNRKHERALLQYCDDVPIFLTYYPKSLKPFYMKSACDSGRPDKVHNFDLIAPFGGEICGGSLREDNLGRLEANLNLVGGGGGGGEELANASRQQQDNPFRWYLDLRRFGAFPHGGFGLGVERLLQSLLGVKNIKDTIAFPRWPGNCSM